MKDRSLRRASFPLALLLSLCVGMPSSAYAQDARDALRRGSDAWDLAEFDSAVPLLSRGLDPAGGPTDSLWITGVHKLVEAHLDLGNDSVAVVWARFAMRLVPNMQVDDVNFTPAVVELLEDARDFVQAGPIDPLVAEVEYQWAGSAGAASRGRLRLEGGSVAVQGRIEQLRRILNAGQPAAIAAGSYTVSVTAAGFLPARITAEVLPGVTTALRVNLLPVNSGYLYVTSRPWAAVSLDGEMVGYTTIAGRRVAPGDHQLRLFRDGYLSVDTTVTVAEDERVRVGLITLRPLRPE